MILLSFYFSGSLKQNKPDSQLLKLLHGDGHKADSSRQGNGSQARTIICCLAMNFEFRLVQKKTAESLCVYVCVYTRTLDDKDFTSYRSLSVMLFVIWYLILKKSSFNYIFFFLSVFFFKISHPSFQLSKRSFRSYILHSSVTFVLITSLSMSSFQKKNTLGCR